MYRISENSFAYKYYEMVKVAVSEALNLSHSFKCPISSWHVHFKLLLIIIQGNILLTLKKKVTKSHIQITQ